MEESRTAFFSTSSNNRPGVATTMSAFPIVCIWVLTDTPPYTARQVSRSPRAGRNVWKTCWTWSASSRVGTSTSTVGSRYDETVAACRLCRIGST